MRLFERALWVAGIVLLAAWGGVRAHGAWSARREVAHFEAAVAVVDTSQWSASRKESYRSSLEHDSGPAIAVLRIAKIGLEVPVLEGTDELTLDRGAGHIEGTAGPGMEGNVGIAGHRDGFFRALKDVGVGDVIQLRVPERTIDYIVGDVRIVAPDDVSVLEATGAPSLTLVTCYPFYFVGPAPQRYVVRAVRR